MAYMSVETWAHRLLPNPSLEVRAAVTDPNYMAELLLLPLPAIDRGG